jgi:DNA-binding CsgD family transcriptional regulator
VSKSSQLRVYDIRQAYRLIGDCRDLAAVPEFWQQRMFDGLLALVGADRSAGGEGAWAGPHRDLQILSAHWSGFDQRTLNHLLAYNDYLRANGPISNPLLSVLPSLPGPVNTRARTQVMSDRDWYRGEFFNEYLRPADCNDQLASSFVTSTGTMSYISVNRRVHGRDFSGRDRRLLHFFHAELGRLIGRVLVSVTDPRPDDLPPRLRQTLHFLLQGDSEKQAAVRLGVTQSTAHEYVVALYRRFGVHSRAELMAYAMRRFRQPAWRRLQEGDAASPEPDGDTDS